MTRSIEKKRSNSHRGRLDIIAAILEASHRKARKTHLMYYCNLSFKQLENYLNFLVERKLLYSINDSKSDLFKTTEKGERFLDAYKGLLGLMG